MYLSRDLHLFSINFLLIGLSLHGSDLCYCLESNGYGGISGHIDDYLAILLFVFTDFHLYAAIPEAHNPLYNIYCTTLGLPYNSLIPSLENYYL